MAGGGGGAGAAEVVAEADDGGCTRSPPRATARRGGLRFEAGDEAERDGAARAAEDDDEAERDQEASSFLRGRGDRGVELGAVAGRRGVRERPRRLGDGLGRRGGHVDQRQRRLRDRPRGRGARDHVIDRSDHLLAALEALRAVLGAGLLDDLVDAGGHVAALGGRARHRRLGVQRA